jgi:thymidylate synthase
VQPYLEQVRTILERGEERRDRTGTGTLSLFGMQARYDLREGFPLVTTK